MTDFKVGDQILIHNCDAKWWNGKEGVVTKLIVDRCDIFPFEYYIDVDLSEEGRQHPYEIAVAQHEIQLKGGPW